MSSFSCCSCELYLNVTRAVKAFQNIKYVSGFLKKMNKQILVYAAAEIIQLPVKKNETKLNPHEKNPSFKSQNLEMEHPNHKIQVV